MKLVWGINQSRCADGCRMGGGPLGEDPADECELLDLIGHPCDLSGAQIFSGSTFQLLDSAPHSSQTAEESLWDDFQRHVWQLGASILFMPLKFYPSVLFEEGLEVVWVFLPWGGGVPLYLSWKLHRNLPIGTAGNSAHKRGLLWGFCIW